MKRIYLDHNALTPVYPEVVGEMMDFLGCGCGNPSSLHSFGQEAKRFLEKARGQVARLISAHSDEILFCSNGTEANNLALIGAAGARMDCGRHILISAIEHQSVLQPARRLQGQGFCVEYLPCNAQGILNLAELPGRLRSDTILISVMTANNDTGVLQPIAEIAELAHRREILLHTDAVAAAGKIPLSVRQTPIDLLTLSSHKIHGPTGAAALYLRQDTRLQPMVWGGNQERKMRGGTENLCGIVGFGKACELAQSRLEQQSRSLRLTG